MKFMYSIGLFLCWIIVVCAIPFMVIGSTATWVATKAMKLGDKYEAKTLLLLALALMLSGVKP